MTNILEIFLNESIRFFKLSEEIVPVSEDTQPLEVKAGTEGSVRREILLKGETSERVWLYADSIIVLDRMEEGFKEDLMDLNSPVGNFG